MQVAIYARVSTKNKGQDTENQVNVLKEYCEKMEYHIYNVYVDEESGATSDRQQFQQMFEDASKRKFKLLLFWSLDRFSRLGSRQTIFLLQRLDDYHVSYKSYTEQYLDTTGIFRDALISLLAALAEQERIRLSDRVICGLKKARSKGRVGGRPRIDENIIEQIAKLKAEGLSNRNISQKLKIHRKTVAAYLRD